MNEKRLFTRRKFLIGSAATLGGVILAWTHRLLGIPVAQAQDPVLTPQVYLPIVFGSGEPLPKPRVVHVRDTNATNWNGTDLFYDAVNQDVVNSMVQTGLQLLTGQDSWPDIWGALFGRVHPGGYSAGQKIAIKVNLNASHDCDSHGNRIDALPQPVLALISGMVAAGVQPGDVTVYDSIRHVPSYLRDPIWAVYPDVRFVGTGSCPGVIAPSHGKDPSLTIQFNDPYGYVNDRQLADVLYDATYVINMPIIKRHGGDNANPVTLAFKNHFGSLNRIGGSGNDNLHLYINTSNSLYRTTYSPFVDIYLNPNIRDKTVLILGDGLYGGTAPSSPPIQSWTIFEGACNSLFFGTDPVAIDCVMADLIVAEGLVSKAHTYDYLFCAEEAGLGVCEGTRSDPGGDPLQEPYGSGYDHIEYIRSAPPKPRVVHVRDAGATNWNGTDLFYNAVDQDVVNSMVQTGLQLLTGQDSWADIWSALFEHVHPGGYSAGQKIAIKVNLNMSRDCDSHGNVIDALPQPVMALISGMVAAGVQPGDITVYDSIRPIPSYLSGPIWAVYPDVKFLGTMGTEEPCPGVIAPSHGKDPSLTVQFNDPDGNLQDRQLADVLYDATYLINMPIIKRHSGEDFNPVTLGFKNHFGSIDRITGSGNDNLHLYIDITDDLYRTTYSPLVDIYRNPNIRGKTILVLGDGLYGGTSWGSPPIESWSIFGGACNSLFFGTDPVATDCVMADLIMAEGLVSTPRTYDHLFCAEEAGLGVCEGTRSEPGGDPLQTPYGSGYDHIEYIRVDT